MLSRRILLVDDNPNDLELAMMALSELHTESSLPEHHVTVAYSGMEAINLLKNSKETLPDLILLDLKMPHMDGLAVLDIIRAESSLREIPVVMLTTSGEGRDIEQAYAKGASGYVVKPLEFAQFRETMQAIRAFWMNINRTTRYH